MMAGDRDSVLAAATSEKSPQLRAEAVRQLAMMGARDEVWQLYQKETDAEVREQMIRALFLGGDSGASHRGRQQRLEYRAAAHERFSTWACWDATEPPTRS